MKKIFLNFDTLVDTNKISYISRSQTHYLLRLNHRQMLSRLSPTRPAAFLRPRFFSSKDAAPKPPALGTAYNQLTVGVIKETYKTEAGVPEKRVGATPEVRKLMHKRDDDDEEEEDYDDDKINGRMK